MLKNCDIALFLLTKGAVGYDWVASEAGAAKAFRMVRGKPNVVSLVFPDGQVLKPIESFTYKKLSDTKSESAAIEAHALINADLLAQKTSTVGVLFETASEWEPGVKLLATVRGLITAVLSLVAGLYLRSHH